MRILCLAVCCGLLAAADDSTELRLLAGGFPGYSEVQYDGDEHRTLALDDDRGFAIQGEAVLRYETGSPVHPWVLAGGAARFTDAMDETGSEHSVVAFSWLLGVGVGARLGKHVIVEAGVVGSLGDAGIADERIDAVSMEESTWYVGGEARVGLWLEYERAMIGAVAGWAAHTTLREFYDRDGDDRALTLESAYEGDGAFFLVGLGIRLD
jgi:hypothetical protein